MVRKTGILYDTTTDDPLSGAPPLETIVDANDDDVPPIIGDPMAEDEPTLGSGDCPMIVPGDAAHDAQHVFDR